MGQKKKGSPGVFSRKGVSSSPSTSSTSHTSSPSSSTQRAPASTTTKPASTPAPVTKTQNTSSSNTAKPNANAQQTSATGAQPAQTGGGGSLLGSLATTAIGSMAGVMAADAIMGSFKGEEKNETTVQQNAFDANNGPCSPQYQAFFKCIENNSASIGQCQWAYDMFAQCKSTSNHM